MMSENPVSLSDMVCGLLEEDEMMFKESYSSCESQDIDVLDDDCDEEKKNQDCLEGDKMFWETQQQLLQSVLFRTSSLESRIRCVTKEALREIQATETACGCGKQRITNCRNCLMREVSRRLQNAGFNTAICKTKWRSSLDIPSGEHTFLDVLESSERGEMRVIIELNFRAEFEMVRGSEEYNKLIQRLPEVYVGKVERLENVIKILCSAAKKCMKDRKIHMGPWRKQRYMQAKWLGNYERTTTTKSLPFGHSNRVPKPRASMLTFNLLDKFPGGHRPVVEVV